MLNEKEEAAMDAVLCQWMIANNIRNRMVGQGPQQKVVAMSKSITSCGKEQTKNQLWQRAEQEGMEKQIERRKWILA